MYSHALLISAKSSGVKKSMDAQAKVEDSSINTCEDNSVGKLYKRATKALGFLVQSLSFYSNTTVTLSPE